MNIITQADLEDEISLLENDLKKVMRQLKGLHRREKDIKLRNLTRDWSECYLDLYQIRHHKVDYNSDTDFLRLCAIRDQFWKIRM